jgi:hypothetical protein
MALAGGLIRASDSRAVDRATNTSNVTLSTTAGTFTDVVVGNTFTPISGRRYKATFYGGDDLNVAGSGFATTDQWKAKIQVSVAGGAYADLVPGYWHIARGQFAVAMRYAILVGISDYLASSTSTLRFKVAATKLTGASTVTSTLETQSGASPLVLLVEDIGEI